MLILPRRGHNSPDLLRPTKRRLIICVAVAAIVFLMYQFSSMQGLSTDYVNGHHKYHGVAKYATQVTMNQASMSKFSCLTGNIQIPSSYVNDDYCDCPDGSDEPRTSACSDSFFKCSSGYVIGNKDLIMIPTSRINDGICDCCDGSDEFLPLQSSSYLHTLQMQLRPYSKVFISPCHSNC